MTTSDQTATAFASIHKAVSQETITHFDDDVSTHSPYDMANDNDFGLEEYRESYNNDERIEHITSMPQMNHIENDVSVIRDYDPLIPASEQSQNDALQTLMKRKSPRILTEKERRINHSRSEQRRRQQLKAALSVLEQLIPDDISLDMSLISEISGLDVKNMLKEQINAINANISSPSTEATIINRAVLYIRRLTLEQASLGSQINQINRARQSQCSVFQYQYPSSAFSNHNQSIPTHQQTHLSTYLPLSSSNRISIPTLIPSGSSESSAPTASNIRNTNAYSTDTITIPLNNTNQQLLYNHHQTIPRNVQSHHEYHDSMDSSLSRCRELLTRSRDSITE